MKKIILLLIIILSITPYSFASAAENVLKNSSFEDISSNTPSYWHTEAFDKSTNAVSFLIEQKGGHSGNNYVTIINNVKNDSRYIQTIQVEANKKYRLSCWVKTENIETGGKGANISITQHLETSKDIKGTSGDWDYLEMYADVINSTSVNVSVGLGAYSNITTGKASFDDIVVEEVNSIPNGAVVAKIEDNHETNSESSNNPTLSSSGLLFWLCLLAFALVLCGLIIILNSRYKLKKKTAEEADSMIEKVEITIQNDIDEEVTPQLGDSVNKNLNENN